MSWHSAGANSYSNVDKPKPHHVQENICFNLDDIKCVNEIMIDYSGCLRPCSGLIGSTNYENAEDRFTSFRAYDHYKRITENPSGYNGNDK